MMFEVTLIQRTEPFTASSLSSSSVVLLLDAIMGEVIDFSLCLSKRGLLFVAELSETSPSVRLNQLRGSDDKHKQSNIQHHLLT